MSTPQHHAMETAMSKYSSPPSGWQSADQVPFLRRETCSILRGSRSSYFFCKASARLVPPNVSLQRHCRTHNRLMLYYPKAVTPSRGSRPCAEHPGKTVHSVVPKLRCFQVFSMLLGKLERDIVDYYRHRWIPWRHSCFVFSSSFPTKPRYLYIPGNAPGGHRCS